MKNIIKVTALSGLAFVLASCGAANNPYGNNYPNQYPSQYPNNGQVVVYRTPEGGTYRTGEIYRDTNGNVYQNGRIIRTGDVYGQPGILGRNDGVYYPNQNPQNLPPGQAKKIYGGRAKDYAPGQMKKRNGRYADRRWENNRNWNDNDQGENRGNGKYKNKKYDREDD